MRASHSEERAIRTHTRRLRQARGGCACLQRLTAHDTTPASTPPMSPCGAALPKSTRHARRRLGWLRWRFRKTQDHPRKERNPYSASNLFSAHAAPSPWTTVCPARRTASVSLNPASSSLGEETGTQQTLPPPLTSPTQDDALLKHVINESLASHLAKPPQFSSTRPVDSETAAGVGQR